MMKPIKRLGLFVTLMAGVSSPAMAQGNQNPGAGGRYFNADGSRTDNLDAAAATWRALPEFGGAEIGRDANGRAILSDTGKQQIGVEYAFARGLTGRGARVGVVDEGVEPRHSDFVAAGKVRFSDVTNQVDAQLALRPRELVFDGRPIYRIAGTGEHGTHVAGTIAAPRDGFATMGVVPDAQILSGTEALGADMLRDERVYAGKGLIISAPDAFRDIVGAGAKIINNSWSRNLGLLGGATRGAVRNELNRNIEESRRLVDSIVENIVPRNGVIIFAAGNDKGNHAGAQASMPIFDNRLEPHWLSVVNVDSNNMMHNSSNVCGQTMNWCISAPGTDIYSAAMAVNMTAAATAENPPLPNAARTAANLFAEIDNWRAELIIPANRFPAGAGQRWIEQEIAAVAQQNLDSQALGRRWALRLFQIAARYGGSPGIASDDMSMFMKAKHRFSNTIEIDGLGREVVSRVFSDSINRVYNLSGRYRWEESPVYHMELEYTRLVEESTTREYGHRLKTGTSMAAPHVSGALALVMERFPYMTAAQARDTLLTTAEDIEERDTHGNVLYAGVDGKYGWGMVNVARAMHGPRAFLKDFNITLPADMISIWENNIADGSEFLPGYGGGLSLAGGGVLILPGRNSYRGQTNVVDGALFIDGTLTNSRAVVSDSGIIGGRGTLLSLTVRSGGAVSPGNPFLDGEEGRFGKLTITNDLIFEPGSLYRVHSRVNAERKMVPVPEGHLNLPGTDLIEVNGSAILNGGTVDLQADQGNWNYRSSADILVAHGGIEGEFEGVSSNLGFLTPRLDHGTNNVTLKLERNDVTFASVGRTPNQVASGAGLDGVPAPRPRGDAPSNRRANAVPAAPRNSSGAPNARVAESSANNRVAASGATNPRAPLSTTAQVAPHAEIAGGSSRASSATASNFSSGGSATFAPETLAAVPAKEVAAASEAAPRATPIAALEQGQLYGALVDSSVDTVSASLDSFSGETHASLAAVAANDTVFVRDAMLRRMPHSTMALAAGSGRDGGNPVASGYVAWGQAIAGVTDRDASFGIGRVKTTSKGFVTGIDKSWDNRVNIGAAFSMLDTDANVFRPGSNNNSVASRHIGAYAGAEVGVARVRAGGSWGWYNIRSGRSASVNAFGDSLSAKYKGRALQAFGEVGLGFETGSLSLEPFVNVTHVNFLGKDIAEKGGAASLSGRSKQKVTMSTIGVRSAVKIADGADGRSGFAKLNIGWRHNLDNAESGATANLSFAGAPKSFTVIGAAPGKDLAIVDLALDTPVTENLDIGVSYGGQFSDKFTAQALKATLQLRF